jgi:hypothetical protein
MEPELFYALSLLEIYKNLVYIGSRNNRMVINVLFVTVIGNKCIYFKKIQGFKKYANIKVNQNPFRQRRVVSC